MRQLAKYLKPQVDLFARERLQTFRAKLLHRKGTHDAAIEHGLFQHPAAYLALRGDVAHEAAGKAIPSAGRIADLVQRQRRSPERMMPSGEFPVAKENGRTVLTMLDDQRAWPQFQHLSRRTRQAAVASQHLGFGVVD